MQKGSQSHCWKRETSSPNVRREPVWELKQAMGYNSSRLPDSWCSFLIIFNASESSSLYYRVTLTTCVISSLLAPMIVAANTFILAAIWKNPSLRTPSYVLLAGLALTDFCTGLSCSFFMLFLDVLDHFVLLYDSSVRRKQKCSICLTSWGPLLKSGTIKKSNVV